MQFPFLLGARGHLSSGSVRFVTHRAALTMAMLCAVVFSVIALAAGVAIGMRLSGPASTAQERPAQHTTRDFVVGEIGKLSASVAQIEPRIAHLAKQIGELRHLQTRLTGKKAAPPHKPLVPAAERIPEGEGGPMLPPRHCPEAPMPPAQANAEIMQQQIDCIGALLTLLEREAVAHANVWATIPGREPVDGAHLGSAFGNRVDPFNRRPSFHSGIDLVAPAGTPILASAGGRVIYVGEREGYGKVVEIDHGNGLVTRYAHASRLVVRAGDIVFPRQHIADVGSTGRSTGPHLHMEVLEHGAPVNPAGYLGLFAEQG